MPTKRFIVIVNPRGGTRRGPVVLDEVKPIFAEVDAALDVRLTTHAGHASQLAQTLDLNDCDGLCVVGGDGTIHEVIAGLMKRDVRSSVPLGLIPAGTGNAVCEHLRCPNPGEAAQRIVGGATRALDVARAQTGDQVAYCVNIIGWGAAVDINRTAERLRWMGPPRYATSAIAHILRPKPRRARVVLDEQVLEDEFRLIVACNTKFTGKGMQLAPQAEMDDGKLDVVVVRRATRWQMLKMFTKVFDGSHLALPFVEYYQVRTFGIEPEHEDCLNLDGEVKVAGAVSAEMMPAELRVFV